MLGRLPSEDMFEVRAILLGRLGRHEGALQIYVYQLEDHKTAEQCVILFTPFPLRYLGFPFFFSSLLARRLSRAVDADRSSRRYCKRVYDSDPTMQSTIFHLLLRLYLRPRPGHPLLFEPALSLLATHAARIDPIEAFDLLPPLVSVSDIKVYLEKTLRRSGERKREAMMVKGIEKASQEDAEWKVLQLEERRVKVSEGRVCVIVSFVFLPLPF